MVFMFTYHNDDRLVDIIDTIILFKDVIGKQGNDISAISLQRQGK